MLLDDRDIGEAVVEYLARRGISVGIEQLSIGATQGPTKSGEVNWKFTVTVKDVQLPPKEGPYR